MPTLHEVGGCGNPARVGDVVFLHGLGGHHRETWEDRLMGDQLIFWPELLAESIKDIGVWSIEYEASKSDWGGHSMPLIERSTNLLASLDINGIGERPIVFVAHSLGGLVVKQMLRASVDRVHEEATYRISQQTKGIVFFATPHQGSMLANLNNIFRVVTRPSKASEGLKLNDSYLLDLNTWFRNNQGKLNTKVQVFREMHPIKVGLVVDAASSDPGLVGVTPIPVQHDHISICKIPGTHDDRFKQVVRFVRSCFRSDTPKPPLSGPEIGGKFSLDVGVDIEAAKENPRGEMHANEFTLKYLAKQIKGESGQIANIEITPKMGYLDLLYNDGTLPPIKFHHQPFNNQFPNLDLKVVSNLPESIFLSEAIFVVDRSIPDLSPVLVFRDKNTLMKMNISNEGWGEISNPVLHFNVFPTGVDFQVDPPIGHIPNEVPYKYSYPIDNFCEDIELDLSDFFSYIGIDVEAIRCGDYPSRIMAAHMAYAQTGDPMAAEFAQHIACFPTNLLESAVEPFLDGYVVLSGVIEYDGMDRDRNPRHYVTKFRSKVFLFRPKYEIPVPPSAQYNIALDPEGENYEVSCPISHALTSGQFDRFNIRVACSMSATHHFRIRLLFAGDIVVESQPIVLHHFVPRSWAKWQGKLLTLEETIAEAALEVDSTPYRGCVVESFEMMTSLASIKQQLRPPSGLTEGPPVVQKSPEDNQSENKGDKTT